MRISKIYAVSSLPGRPVRPHPTKEAEAALKTERVLNLPRVLGWVNCGSSSLATKKYDFQASFSICNWPQTENRRGGLKNAPLRKFYSLALFFMVLSLLCLRSRLLFPYTQTSSIFFLFVLFIVWGPGLVGCLEVLFGLAGGSPRTSWSIVEYRSRCLVSSPL